MELQDGQNHFHLRLISYQFPSITTEKYDSNWLVVEGSVRQAGESWRFRDPCLLTWEVEELAQWFEKLANGQLSTSEVSFIEPNISFSLQSNGTLRVSFALEARPPSGQVTDEEEVSLSIAIEATSLRLAAQSLRLQLAQFPQR